MLPNWSKLKDRHRGETCLVIGNGPSLKKVPRELLERYPSFGTNRIYILPFIPTYYVCTNPYILHQWANQIQLLPSLKFIRDEYADYVCGLHLKMTDEKIFSLELDIKIHGGFTVTYACLQLAHYMGFDTVLLVGVDHRYKYDGSPNQPVDQPGPDTNHFDSGYFPEGCTWQNPDLANSKEAYSRANAVFNATGRRIINLGPDSALDIFEMDNINNW